MSSWCARPNHHLSKPHRKLYDDNYDDDDDDQYSQSAESSCDETTRPSIALNNTISNELTIDLPDSDEDDDDIITSIKDSGGIYPMIADDSPQFGEHGDFRGNVVENDVLVTGDYTIDSIGIRRVPSRGPNKELSSPEESMGSFSETKHQFVLFGDRIGRGNSGVVSKALNLSDFRVYALKSVGSHREEDRKQMVHELDIFHSVSCKYLVSFNGAFYRDNQLHFILEYMNRGSLQSILERQPLDVAILRRISKHVLLGLQHMHNLRQMHRDIKPANILLSRAGYAKLTDFGIARIMEPTKDEVNTFVGTRIYMSPERLSTKPYSTSSDIWSFGLTIQTLAEGQFPFSYETCVNFLVLYNAVTTEGVPQLSDEYPDDFRDFLSHCLEIDPEKRWTTKQLLEHEFVADEEAGPIRWPWAKEKVFDNDRDMNDLESIAGVMAECIFSEVPYMECEETDTYFQAIADSLDMKMSTVRSIIVRHLPFHCLAR